MSEKVGRPKVRRGKYVTTMAFSEAEMVMFDAAVAKLGLDRISVVRLALRDYCKRLGIAVEVERAPRA